MVSRLFNPVSHGQGVSNTTLLHTTSDLLKASKQHSFCASYQTYLNEQQDVGDMLLSEKESQ
jgi:hypothetical protein